MRTKFSGILTLLLAFVVQISFAQEKTVTGTVTDPDGLPLPGVNIVIEDTSTGTQTDFDGNYSIQVSEGETLVFSYVGFVKQEIKVGNSNSYNVSMSSDNTLDEVVVQAYRTSSEKKSNIASSTVTSSTIENRPNANVIQTLQGQVAGLNIQTGSGQPGANSTVILRGAGSINGSIEPLYIIDGVPQNGDNFRSLNPNEIASVSVLKDAGATAIYGNRGANGVIIVETKRGSYNSSLEINYIGATGFTELQGNDYDLMNSQQLLTLENKRGLGLGATLTEEEIANYEVNTDWNDYFFRTGISQSHTLNLSSGSKNLASFTSLGYFNQEGILKTTDLNRFTFRNNLQGKSDNDKFNYSTNLTINWSRRNEATNVGTGGVNQNYVLGANNSAPYLSPSLYENSDQLFSLYQEDGTLLYTPLMLIDKLNNFSNQYDELKSIANISGSYKITDNITASANLGLDYTQTVRNVSIFGSI
ncbi:SusC/RagA family TonB-linked outer membrane protein [Mesonia maritima]|uniref:SusC/RagA family TonB-linked outer membrane protein n=1 Tax=Mesonia maritima TaxID=1793873 RepID=UPI003629EF6E